MSQKSANNNREPLDAWVIFEHLYGAQRKDLIDYLIHQLYYLSDDDIDFFIPQMCTLLVSRDAQISKQLECFILHKCMKSIDFAIKCFWNLHAIQFYSKQAAHQHRCDEMRQNLEMIVVNGQLPRNLITQLPKDIQRELHIQNAKENGRNSKNQNNGHSNKPLNSALPQPKKPNNLPTHNDPLLNGATEYLKKQRRCTYFNAELDFAHFLEGVSSALEQCDREDRPRLLEDNIRYANKCLPRGLYIPIGHTASESHKSLLRIVPNEGKCLDSKQKVPFLLFCETEQHSYPTSSPMICEELTESETALLSSSGLYVLIDEHRKRHHKQRNRLRKDINSTDSQSKKAKKDINPKRLKPKVRKPSRLSYKKKQNKKKQKDFSDMALSKSVSDPRFNGHECISTPTPPVENTVSGSNIDAEYSISSKNISHYSDEEEAKGVLSLSDSANSQTVSVPNKRINLSAIPTPQPKPIDKVAEEAMKRHLEALKPFEPANHKAFKGIDNNKKVARDDQMLMCKSDKNTIKTQSAQQLLTPVNKSSAIGMFGRSRTPEPDKTKRFFRRNNVSQSDGMSSKSDGNGTDSPTGAHHNHNHFHSQSPHPQPQIIVNSKVGVVKSIKYNNGVSNERKRGRNKNKNAQKPSVVIYRHPNYENSKLKKLQYLRGKSMQWKDPFGEAWDQRRERYRKQSPFLSNDKWSMQSVIFKSGEDMRQEQMAMQFIKLFNNIWKNAKLPLQLRPYSVVVTSPASGFVETVPNSVSISRLKHSITNFVSLRKFFEQFYGPIGSPGFQMAQKNFVESMAGYSLVAYFLQIKDRHNGNILLTSDGRIVHIDFDFLFSNSPGGNIGFESAPFKLTEEFIQVMGGEENSEMFDYFKILLIRGFLEARKHVRKFVLLSKIMIEGAPMPAFLAGPIVIKELKERFATNLKNEKCVEFVYNLIEESSCNWRSVQYDKFQRITNNIL